MIWDLDRNTTAVDNWLDTWWISTAVKNTVLTDNNNNTKINCHPNQALYIFGLIAPNNNAFIRTYMTSQEFKVYTWGDSHIKRMRVLIRIFVDCQQSLFSSKIRGEERNPWGRTQYKKARERDCERDVRAAMPRAANSVGISFVFRRRRYQRQRRHDHSHARKFACFEFFPQFSRKRETAQAGNSSGRKQQAPIWDPLFAYRPRGRPLFRWRVIAVALYVMLVTW